MSYKIIDLFAGVGGLSLGFEMEGFNVVVANEYDIERNVLINIISATQSATLKQGQIWKILFFRDRPYFSSKPCQKALKKKLMQVKIA